MKCTPDVLEEILRPVETVIREDLESLSRLYSVEERLELWNSIKSSWKRYRDICKPVLPPEEDRFITGKFRLAQLLIATTFKINKEGFEDIVSMFRPEEYEIIMDFEEYKIFDNLDVDEIVEMIRRREGRVYELVKKYYEKQYNMLDREWGKLIGPLALAIEAKYRRRREKIEQAVIEYVKRYGLLTTISEIEEAVKRIYEATEFRHRVEEEVRRRLEEIGLKDLEFRLKLLEEERRKLLDLVKSLEEKAVRAEVEKERLRHELEMVMLEKERVMKEYEAVSRRLEEVEKLLNQAREELRKKEEELKRLEEEYSKSREVVAMLNNEIEMLRNTIKKLEEEAQSYRDAMARLENEKRGVEERLAELEKAIRGEGEGRVITLDEAIAYQQMFLSRIGMRVRSVEVYDPISRKSMKIDRWDRIEFSYLDEVNGKALGKVVRYELYRGVFTKRRAVVVEAVTLLHPENYRSYGYDHRAVGLQDLLEVLTPRAEEAEREGYYHILVIGSPTGFTKKVIDYVTGVHAFRSPNLTLYLVDLATGRIYYNPSDDVAERNKDVARIEMPEERIRKVIEFVTSETTKMKAVARSPAAPYILIEEIARECGEELDVVRTALARLESMNVGKVVITKDGTEAFVYR